MTSRTTSSSKVARVAALVVLVFAAPLAASCFEHEDGAALDVDVIVVHPEGDPAEWTTDLGYRLRLERAYLTVGAVTLEACERAAVRAWLLPRAFAHSESSALRIGEPHVVDLLHDDAERLGTLTPPRGSYCSMDADLEPADDDAAGLPADADLVGATLVVEGTLVALDGTESALSLRVATTRDVPLSLSPPRNLGASDTAIAIELDVKSAFDGIDFAALTAEEQARAVLGHLALAVADG